MDPASSNNRLLTECVSEGVITKDGKKYITELDETKEHIADRYEVLKTIGKVRLIL